MKPSLLIFSFITISFNCFSQDWIEKTDGNIIKCEIISIDSTSAHIIYNQGDQKIKAYISADQIKSIVHDDEVIPPTFTLDSIYIKKGIIGNDYYFKGVEFQRSELKRLLSLNEQARKLLTKINTHNAAAIVLCVAGTLVIAGGIMVDKIPSYQSTKSDFFFTGGAIIILAIPIYFSAIPKWHKAIDYYNADLIKTTSGKNTKLKLGFTANGIGVRMVF